jgi:hypothetical protein
MKIFQNTAVAAASLAALAASGLSACSSGSNSASSSTAAASPSESPVASSSATSTAKADPAANLVGTGCAGHAQKVPVEGGEVTVTRSGNDLKVNNASVRLRFTPANATVYLIDTVMTPPM